ncbi:histidinol dehydrogenase [Anoxynatronum buryatiense]|uniref:Histidinol dehydrogenase n=1 Tax=Anoxynatronum buryatiense TaxID=489973 RepID=A0AA45WVV9_9CLOT|nr:histidinol dehydrogenase [Anoxynatronum buryatiense]SMP55056.1 histidinol dehydrogenase [Anoxynatronum buryatiense]
MSQLPVKRWDPSRREIVIQELRDRQAGYDRQTEAVVREIIATVKEKGDEALLDYTARFDRASLTPETLRVTEKEMETAWRAVDEPYRQALENACRQITAFHQKQRQESWFENPQEGIWLGQKVTPLDVAGVYVPGGKAAYPSSVLMNVVPARVAGVSRIVMATPPGPDGTIAPVILAAARVAGVTEIYKMGGAQAVAALAYGTATIPRVDKITGPGNQYVAMAKQLVYGQVDIDMIAGPSEILVIADETANAAFVAADMLSQAEHDEMASAVCITTSQALGEAVAQELEKQVAQLDREAIARESLERFGGIWVTATLAEAAALANDLAPEHLELCVANPFELVPAIRHAGAIFLGHYSPEPLGDYLAGPNHVLPTGGTARFASPLTVEDFVKKSSLIYYSRERLAEAADDIMLLAEREGFQAHKQAVAIRMKPEIG